MQKNSIEWVYTVALTTGASINIELGNNNSGNLSKVPVTDFNYLTYSLQSELVSRIVIAGSADPSFTTSDILVQHDIAAATFTTPYDLSAPINQNGFIIITKPFIQITLSDQATSNHSYTRFYAKAWC